MGWCVTPQRRNYHLAMDTLTRSEVELVKRNAYRGKADAQWMLGYWYEAGVADASGSVLLAANAKKALRWHLAAAEQGHTSAQAAASRLLSGTDGIASKFDQALAWGKQATAQGDSSAAFNLGTMYRDLGNLGRAFHWYQRAARMGASDAWLQQGLCLLFGLGVSRDAGEARSAFTRVVDADPTTTYPRSREDALYWLAIMDLLGGRHTKRSLARIRQRLEAANIDEDHEQANVLLNLIGKTRYLSNRKVRS